MSTTKTTQAQLKAVILVRVSTKEQMDEGYSLPAQERLLKDYSQRTNLNCVKIFRISETASKKDQRSTFDAMMEYMAANSLKHLVCEKVDRLLRNFKDTVMIEDWLDADDERRVHLVKNNIVLHKNSKSQEKFMWGIHVVVAKNYTDNLREEVAKGWDEKLRQGWLPGVPPRGYKNVGEVKRKIQVIDETVAPLIRLMFELYDSGNFSTLTLTREMRNQGLRTGKDKPLSKSHIYKLLRNRYYIGDIPWDGKTYEGQHEPMIDRELFNRVQQRLTRPNPPKYGKHNPLFKGLITCYGCNASVTWDTHRGHWYGRCKCTGKKYARQDRLEEQLHQYFAALVSPSAAVVAWIKKELQQSHVEEHQLHTASLQQLTQRRDKLGKMVHDLYDDKLEGRITAERHDEKLKDLMEEKAEVVGALKKLNAADDAYITKGLEILDLSQRAAKKFAVKDTDGQRLLLNDLFSNIGLNGQTLLCVYKKEAAVVLDKVEQTREVEMKFEHDENGLVKDKEAFLAASRPIWLGR